MRILLGVGVSSDELLGVLAGKEASHHESHPNAVVVAEACHGFVKTYLLKEVQEVFHHV